ncbi:MAG: helix-turn-helix domain-containing protein [Cenarchaeum sp. SB0663_bin_5]|nr:helix-turn-helix domain-containing protein [Cenarchaeum sp. SB0663_bin_5]MYH04339.1 helix-turn-helix domain-containing protein [Cenarchaeum sp. SB0675_bin_21]MYL10870.1 helix-turn-helix domain-containing protein [Cenarchaeum sp. SB0669_bin_11]
MPKTLVKKGDEYLSCVQLSELEETYRRECSGKSRDRLQAAVLRKRGRMLKEIARTLGRGISTVYRCLYRIECEDLECRHDAKSPGRPRLLNTEQERTIKEGIDGTPRDSGFERGSWNARILARYILKRFDVQYSSRAAIRLAHRLGFSVRKLRPVPYNSATQEEQRKLIKKGRAAAVRWREEGRVVVAVGAATLRDSPVSRRGIRRREGRQSPSTTPSSLST